MKNCYRILSLEASDIYKHEQENGVNVGYKMPEYKSYAYFRLFKNILDHSLDTIKLEEVYPRICRKKLAFQDKFGNNYTLAVVSVKFNYTYKAEDGNSTKVKELRRYLYKNGFNIDGVHYIRYKRSAGSSRDCHFKSLLAQNGLPPIRFHELRHSCASLLIACGVSMKEIQEWLGHSAISTTADIYSHLNYSSKLNVAKKLTNVFGGGTLDVKAQNTSEAQALLFTLFKGAEHEQAVQPDSVIIEETPQVDENIQQDKQIVSAQIIDTESDSVAEYKRAKAEMARLGFETLDEYFDYIEFMKVKAKRNYATT